MHFVGILYYVWCVSYDTDGFGCSLSLMRTVMSLLISPWKAGGGEIQVEGVEEEEDGET